MKLQVGISLELVRLTISKGCQGRKSNYLFILTKLKTHECRQFMWTGVSKPVPWPHVQYQNSLLVSESAFVGYENTATPKI